MEQAIALLCLAVIGTVSTVAVFSAEFEDTLLQRIALAILAVGAFARIPHRLAHADVPPELLLIDIGAALFGVGTWLKFRRRRKHEQRAQCNDRPATH
jgi:hypothetical protein